MTSLHHYRPSAVDPTSLELLFEHGYTVRDVLRAIRSHLKQAPSEAELPAHLGIGETLEKLDVVVKEHPADARELGL